MARPPVRRIKPDHYKPDPLSIRVEQLKKEIAKYLKPSEIKKSPPTQGLLKEIFMRYNGRCVFCGIKLEITYKSRTSAYFEFYNPLDKGGSPGADNIITTCKEHHLFSRPSFNNYRNYRKNVPDIDTFGDLVQALVLAIQEENIGRIQRVKYEMNNLLEEIVHLMRFKIYNDWKNPDLILVEGKNTIPDRIEKIVKNPSEENKKDLEDNVKHILTTKKYRILRSDIQTDKNGDNPDRR